MKIDNMLKLAVGFVSGIMFWFFWILVTMVYSFMPVTKLGHEKIFNIIAPVLYLLIAGKIMNKIFAEKGWKKYLFNMGVILLMAMVALLTADVLMKIVR